MTENSERSYTIQQTTVTTDKQTGDKYIHLPPFNHKNLPPKIDKTENCQGKYGMVNFDYFDGQLVGIEVINIT